MYVRSDYSSIWQLILESTFSIHNWALWVVSRNSASERDWAKAGNGSECASSGYSPHTWLSGTSRRGCSRCSSCNGCRCTTGTLHIWPRCPVGSSRRSLWGSTKTWCRAHPACDGNCLGRYRTQWSRCICPNWRSRCWRQTKLAFTPMQSGG